MGFFGKTLVVVAVGLVLWWMWRRMSPPAPREPMAPPPQQQQAARTPFWKRPKVAAQETETCKTCGAYVTTGAGRCGRDACPY